MYKLSIVIPVYYNELNLKSLYEKLEEVVLSKGLFEVELIFVDDGSGDGSLNELKQLREKDARVKIIKLSRNFGAHTAVLAGLHYASGDCTTVISADLQDPPDIINTMFSKWQEGNKVVLAVRRDREETFAQKFFSNSYYRLMRRIALKNMPKGGFDCYLIDKQVVKTLCKMNEKNSTLSGQILWCGFQTEMIYYVRKKREAGKSKWTLSKKIKLLLDSVFGFSYFPIKLTLTLGIMMSIAGFLYALLIIINKLWYNLEVTGWSSLMVVILIASGVQMIMIGILGEYLWRNFDETRNRPAYIVEEEIGVNDKNDQ